MLSHVPVEIESCDFKSGKLVLKNCTKVYAFQLVSAPQLKRIEEAGWLHLVFDEEEHVRHLLVESREELDLYQA